MERILSYDDGLAVNIEALNVDYFPAHFHKDMQIIYVIKGEVDLRLTYVTYHLKPGDMHFIHIDDIHSLKGVSKDNIILLFNFKEEGFSALYPDFRMQIFTTRVSKDFVTYGKKLQLRNNLFMIVKEMAERRIGFENRVNELSIDMLRILYKDFRGFHIDTDKKVFTHTVSADQIQIDRISRVTNYVYENYPYKISLAEIAESEHISKFYLSHLFQKYVGPSFRDFVAMVRVEMSEHLLLDTDMPITRVSQECGFSHPKYYNEHFEKWFGSSPKEYRKKYQKETVNYVEPIVKEIPLKQLWKYKDVTPIYEGTLKNTNSKYYTLAFSSNILDQEIVWENVLEITVNPPSFSIEHNKSLYINFYESIVSRGIKASISSSDGKHDRIDYTKYNPQDIVITHLKTINENLLSGKRLKWKADFFSGKEGLVTEQGLIKPEYYLFTFLTEMYHWIYKVEKNCLISRENNNYKIIIFNDSDKEAIHVDIIPDVLNGAYRLTEQHLNGDTCFLNYWKQLDYKENLTLKEITLINGMSFPAGKFETIPDMKQYVYHCDVAPLEIIYLDLVKIE